MNNYTELKAENERLKEKFKIESLTDKTTGETIYRSNLVNKYRMILQEIKLICDYKNEYNSIGIDDYKKMIKDIVELIAKAEV